MNRQGAVEGKMETVQYEQELLAAVRTLPAEQVREVLDFATFLQKNSSLKGTSCKRQGRKPPSVWRLGDEVSVLAKMRGGNRG